MNGMDGNTVCGILANIGQPRQRNFYICVMYTHIYTVDIYFYLYAVVQELSEGICQPRVP